MQYMDKTISYMKRIVIFIKIIGLKTLSISKLDKLFTKFMGLKTKYKISFAIIAVILVVAYKFFFAPAWPEEIKMVEAHTVSKGNLLVKTRLLGTIGAKKYFVAAASDNGIVDFVAEAGTKLKQGEVIAHINKPEIQKAYETALEAAKIANSRYQRELNLEKAKASSKHAVEEKYSNLADAQSRLSAAKAGLDKISFIAPFDGIVGSALQHPGSKVHDNSEIVAFYDPEDLVVKFDIPSNLLGNLGTNGKVTINGEEYTTSFIQRALSGGAYTVPAYIDFKCSNCIIGEIIDVDLHIIDKQNIFTLPKACVFIQNGHTMIYKIKDNKAYIGPVKTGVREKDTIEILEGVAAGDIVVLGGQARLYPEVKVKIFEQDVTQRGAESAAP